MDDDGPGGRCSLYADENYGLRVIGAEPSIAGLFACQRFSLRKDGTRTKWDPFKHSSKFQNGDFVNIYCHSVGSGPYANLRNPPHIVIPVVWSKNDKSCKIQIPSLDSGFGAAYSQVRILQAEYDTGTMSARDQEVCERAEFIIDVDSSLATIASQRPKSTRGLQDKGLPSSGGKTLSMPEIEEWSEQRRNQLQGRLFPKYPTVAIGKFRVQFV